MLAAQPAKSIIYRVVKLSFRCLMFGFHKTLFTSKQDQNSRKTQNVRFGLDAQTKLKRLLRLAVGVAADSYSARTRTNIPFLSCYFSVKIHFLFSRSRFFSLSLHVWCCVACNWCVCYAHFKYNLSPSSSSFHSPSLCFPPLIFPSFSYFCRFLFLYFLSFVFFSMWDGSLSFFFTLLFRFILENVEKEENSLTSAKRQKMQEN